MSQDAEKDKQQQQDQPQEQQQPGGEGSYSGTKQYNEGLKKHMNHDIEKEALDAAPKSDQEAREMEEAERIGKSKSKGEDSGMPK